MAPLLALIASVAIFYVKLYLYFHFRIYVIVEPYFFLFVVLWYIQIQLVVAYFVTFLVLSVVWLVFLYSIVGQMYATTVFF